VQHHGCLGEGVRPLAVGEDLVLRLVCQVSLTDYYLGSPCAF
jgi:hypothetical protein